MILEAQLHREGAPKSGRLPWWTLLGPGFSIYSIVTTHGVIHVVGYFATPVATPLDCIAVNAAFVEKRGDGWRVLYAADLMRQSDDKPCALGWLQPHVATMIQHGLPR